MAPVPCRRLLSAAMVLTLASGTALLGTSPVRSLPDDANATRHVLNRLGFGPRPGDVERVRELGLETYIDLQLTPAHIDDEALESRLATFETLALSSRELADRYFTPALEMRQQQQRQQRNVPAAGANAPAAAADAPPSQAARLAAQGPRLVIAELMQARLLRAIASERQLQEVLTDFWFNHFNVFVGKNLVRQYLTEYERDVIRPHVLGSFRELLGAVAHSPAMLIYLDNWQSSAPGERPELAELERRINDARLTPAARQRLTQRVQQMRQARPAGGLNENYARELLELHTLGVDAGYTQQDVIALARIFTGWTVDQPRRGGNFLFRPASHDSGVKTLLGQSFAPAGEAEGEFALDLLAEHPATARHIAFKLAQRFVADEPPASLVDRVARVFTETRGDLREVVRAVVTSPEFFSAAARRAKVKTPLEFVVSAVRATGATLASTQPLVTALQTMGMPLYGSQPPTGYGMIAADWVNTGALLERMNFAVDLVGDRRARTAAGRGSGRSPDRALTEPPVGVRRGAPGQPSVNLSLLAPDTSDASQTRVVDVLLGGVVSDATRDTLARAATAAQLIALALGSPEFQRR